MRKATRNLILHMLTIAERMSGDRLRIVPTGSMHTIYEQQHLKKFITRFGVDCVFDIGANKGQYAKMLREKVNYRGLIISFEPDPELHIRLLAPLAFLSPRIIWVNHFGPMIAGTCANAGRSLIRLGIWTKSI